MSTRPGRDLVDAPRFESRKEYVESLGAVGVWEPYIRMALDQSGLAADSLRSGQVGKYATYLADDVVVKLFGRFPSWETDFATESAMQGLLADLPAPELIATGQLYADEPEPWPFLVTRRLWGSPWSEAKGSDLVVRQLAEACRALHRLAVPDSPVFKRNWLRDHHTDTVTRHRSHGVLPAHLVEQIDGYVAGLPTGRCLTHGDLTEDHIFIADDALEGVIDWGDAQATDPMYDLSPLYICAFGCDPMLLRTFLDAYGWPVDGDFVHHAMAVTLVHRKTEALIDRIAARMPLADYDSLHDLATRLWMV